MTYIFEIYNSYCIRCILAFFDSIISFYVMGLFVYSTYVFNDHRRLPLKISFQISLIFPVQPLISLVFWNIFYCSNFQMTFERSYNWNAWLISSPACSWFGFNKKMRFTAGVTSEKLQSRPIMTKLDPTQPSHMHSTMHFSFYLLIRHSKNENIKYIEKCQRYKRLNQKNWDIWA